MSCLKLQRQEGVVSQRPEGLWVCFLVWGHCSGCWMAQVLGSGQGVHETPLSLWCHAALSLGAAPAPRWQPLALVIQDLGHLLCSL